MALDDEVLQPYIERLLALQSERAESLTAAELREVAYDLGLTDADLEAAEESAEKGLQRGLGYLQHGRHDDAVRELSAAAALAPERTDILQAAACAHRDRYRARGHAEDRSKAERFARRCLELDPTYQPSFVLLNELDGTAAETVTPEVPGPIRNRNALLAAMLLAALIAFVVALLVVRLPPPAGGAARVAVPEVLSSAPPVAPQPPQVVVPDAPAAPVEFVVPEALAGLKLSARRSKLDYYGDHGFYKLFGEVRNGSTLEFHQLKALVEVLDDQGTVVAADTTSILSDHEADFRPGDVLVHDSLTRVTKPATKARVTIQDYEGEPAGTAYASPRPVSAKWAFERPEDLNIAVAERSSSRAASGYFAAEFAITNTGTRPIKLMKFQMRYLDKAGQQLATGEFYLTITSQPSLPVGETWARATIHEVPESFGGYELVVIEAQ